MIPPSFGDVALDCRNLFTKEYNYGSYKVDVSSKTNGWDFTSLYSSNHDSKEVSGNATMKYNLEDYNAKLKWKLTTSKFMEKEIEWTPKFLDGFKMLSKFSLEPETGHRQSSLKFNYKRDLAHVESQFEQTLDGYRKSVALTLAHSGCILGYKLRFDSQDLGMGSVALNKGIFGYKHSNYQLYISIEDFNRMGIHALVNQNKNLTTGIQFYRSVTDKGKAIDFSFGAKYKTDEGSYVGAKLDNHGKVGVFYKIPVLKDVKLTMSTLIDAKNFGQGGHKMGLGIKYEN
ncbi:hypothetical protein A3Q56_05332 [Intoshia linei]|uniref:Uncharacterized protein n=1 Tax=Intoshia linei TaxID=1819745 RepID=A0A177AYA0_9BILA|nr:hypothetical protein A3Q56_05332 [Intoshia linei]